MFNFPIVKVTSLLIPKGMLARGIGLTGIFL
jgi:hypothetical protein